MSSTSRSRRRRRSSRTTASTSRRSASPTPTSRSTSSSARTRPRTTKADEGSEVTLTVSAGADTVPRRERRRQVLRRRATHPRGPGLQGAAPGRSQLDRRRGPRHPHQPGRRPTRAEELDRRRCSCRPGVEQIAIPDVAGQDSEAAFTTLGDAGFAVREVTESSSSVELGQGHAHRSAGRHAGRRAARRCACSCRAARRRSRCPKCAVRRRPTREATLSNRGLTSSVITQVDDANVGKVVDQSPAGGQRVSPGSNVVLTVGDRELVRHDDNDRPRPGRDRARARVLVRARGPARPAVAGDARPLGGARVRSDAAADAGRARPRRVAGVHGAVPRRRDRGGRRARRGDRGVGPARLSAPGAMALGSGGARRPRRLARGPAGACPASVATPRPRSRPRSTTPTSSGIEVNIRRVCERVAGRGWANARPRPSRSSIAEPLRGRDRLLALMDLGATVCTAREPRVRSLPDRARRARRAARSCDETKHRQARYEGSFRQRRGSVMAELRAHDDGRRRRRSTARRSTRSCATASPRSPDATAHLPLAQPVL